ncbi:MAG: ATP-binding protein, partial [Verrucomicrobiota bacterium]
EASHGVIVTPMEGSVPVTPGSRIRVEGVAESDGPLRRIRPVRITPRGTLGLPEPRSVSFAQLKQADVEFARVAVEGTVLATSPVEGPRDVTKPDALVVLSTPDGIVALQVQPRSPALELAPMSGRHVRASGIASPVVDPIGRVIDVAVIVTPLDAIHATPNKTALPEVPVTTIQEASMAQSSDPTNTLRIQGIVTAMPARNAIFVQDASGAMMVRSTHPIAAQPGDRVEAEGVPRREMVLGGAVSLEAGVTVALHATHLKTGPPGDLPQAARVGWDDLDHNAVNFLRIEVDALVLASARLGDPTHFRVSLRCGQLLLDALGTHPDPKAPLPAARSRILVRGVLDQRSQPDTQYQPLRVHVARLEDIVVVAPPPSDPARILAWVAGIVAALGLLSLAWAFTLRRGVRLRTAQLAAANASLAAASRARADFLAHMSHEVRTPVHAMNGLLQLLARRPGEEESRSILQRLSSAARSLTHLVNDALDLSKIDAGQLALDPQPFHPNGLLDHLDGLFATLAREKGLTWLVERLPDDAPRLVGDSFRLQQVLSNLASNAIKFTRHGHVHVRASLAPAAAPAGLQTLSIACEDSGMGIAPEFLGRLFQPYSQADASIQRTHGGTGLGLAISRRLVERMGGTLHAESQPGVGSIFRVQLPLPVLTHADGPSHGPAAHDAAVHQPPQGQRLAGRRILVADDHPTNLGILEAAIEQENGCSLLVPDGLAALHAITEDPRGFDAVVMDLEMPVMDGPEAIRRIRAIPGCEGLPIVACSAGIRANKRQAALSAGADGFLPKPFDLDDLVHALVLHLKPRPDASPPTAHPPRPPTPSPTSLEGAPAHPPLPLIEGIDPHEAARRFSGSPTVFLLGLGRFHAEFSRLQPELQRDVHDGRRDGVARRLHGLAGAASMLGATPLAVAASDMEQRLRHDAPRDPLPPWESFLPLMHDLARLLDAIASHAHRHEVVEAEAPGDTQDEHGARIARTTR